MNKGVTCIFAFAVGAAAGALATWRILKAKYEREVQDEIDSFKKFWSERQPSQKLDDETKIEDILEDEGYVKYTDAFGNTEEVTKLMEKERPYVISPEEFGERDGYQVRTDTLIYYADGILADNKGVIIKTLEDHIGPDALERFGEYEPDTVFVRNEKHGTDYEILRDYSNYSEIWQTEG